MEIAYLLGKKRVEVETDGSVLLGIGGKGWRQGLVQVTYIGDVDISKFPEMKDTKIEISGGTSECVFMTIKGKVLRRIWGKDNEVVGQLGFLEVCVEDDDDCLIIMTNPEKHKGFYWAAVYWLNFEFE